MLSSFELTSSPPPSAQATLPITSFGRQSHHHPCSSFRALLILRLGPSVNRGKTLHGGVLASLTGESRRLSSFFSKTSRADFCRFVVVSRHHGISCSLEPWVRLTSRVLSHSVRASIKPTSRNTCGLFLFRRQTSLLGREHGHGNDLRSDSWNHRGYSQHPERGRLAREDAGLY